MAEIEVLIASGLTKTEAIRLAVAKGAHYRKEGKGHRSWSVYKWVLEEWGLQV